MLNFHVINIIGIIMSKEVSSIELQKYIVLFSEIFGFDYFLFSKGEDLGDPPGFHSRERTIMMTKEIYTDDYYNFHFWGL